MRPVVTAAAWTDGAASIIEIILVPLLARHLLADLVIEFAHVDMLRTGDAVVGEMVPVALAAEDGTRRVQRIVARDRVPEAVGDHLVGLEAGAVLVDAAHRLGVTALFQAGRGIEFFPLLL